jgi:hypothetical protein
MASPEQQIRFLNSIQRVLDEGQFNSTYTGHGEEVLSGRAVKQEGAGGGAPVIAAFQISAVNAIQV